MKVARRDVPPIPSVGKIKKAASSGGHCGYIRFFGHEVNENVAQRISRERHSPL
jgi:hypothetical protein